MRKHLAILCAAMLCACCLALAACGGSSSSSAASASSGSASASAAASSESPSASSAAASASSEAVSSSAATGSEEGFVGTWQIAAIIYQGVTMTGDFSAMFGEGMNMSFTIDAGGTGSASMNDETKNLTWEKKGDNVISLKVEGGGEVEEATYEDGALKLKMPSGEFDGTAILTKDGTYEGAPEIKASDATPITSPDALVGDWTLIGLSMMGMSMTGDKDALLQALGGTGDTVASFKADGTGKLMGQDVKWSAGADGATVDMSGISIAVKALGDDIAIDMGSLLGMEALMVFSK